MALVYLRLGILQHMTEKKLEKNDPVRNWSWVVYPESAPENWRTLLDETGEKWIESPLHDKDINETTNKPKKGTLAYNNFFFK